MLCQDFDCGQRFQRGHISRTGHHDIRAVGTSLLAHSQMPSPAAQCATRIFDPEILEFGLFSRDHDVDEIARFEARLHDAEQRVCVRWQIHTDGIRLLVDDVVDEARVLVLKPLWSWRQTWELSR